MAPTITIAAITNHFREGCSATTWIGESALGIGVLLAFLISTKARTTSSSLGCGTSGLDCPENCGRHRSDMPQIVGQSSKTNKLRRYQRELLLRSAVNDLADCHRQGRRSGCL